MSITVGMGMGTICTSSFSYLIEKVEYLPYSYPYPYLVNVAILSLN